MLVGLNINYLTSFWLPVYVYSIPVEGCRLEAESLLVNNILTGERLKFIMFNPGCASSIFKLVASLQFAGYIKSDFHRLGTTS